MKFTRLTFVSWSLLVFATINILAVLARRRMKQRPNSTSNAITSSPSSKQNGGSVKRVEWTAEEAEFIRVCLKHPLFHSFSKKAVAHALSLLGHQKFVDGQTIVAKGEYGEAMYIVVKGNVAMAGSPGEPVRKLGVGDYFGEFCMLFGGLHLKTCRAAAKCEVVTLSKRDFLKLVVTLGSGHKRMLDRMVAAVRLFGTTCSLKHSDTHNEQIIQRELENIDNCRRLNAECSNHYEIVEMSIGRGIFSDVHAAKDLRSGEFVALKELKNISGGPLSDAQLLMIERDIELLASLQHEKLPRCYGMIKMNDGNKHYVVLELLTGGSLLSQIREHGSLPESSCRRYIRDVLQGLGYLHEKGLLHRDVKPTNILLTENKESAKLIDFGVSEYAPQQSGEEAFLMPMRGTAPFLSPQAVNGKYSIHSDIWAAGCTLLEMVVGAPPWHELENLSRDELLRAIANSTSPPKLPHPRGAVECEECANGVTPQLYDLLEKMLSRDTTKPVDVPTLLQHEWFAMKDEELPKDPLPPTEFELREDSHWSF